MTEPNTSRSVRWRKYTQHKAALITMILKVTIIRWQPAFPGCGKEPSLSAAVGRPSVPQAGR